MATSGDSDFSYNRNQIIRAAGRKIGAFAAGETPGAQTVKDFSDALNALVKRWDAQGIHLWTETEAILFPQPGQYQYAIGPGTTDHATEDYAYTTTTENAAVGATSISLTSSEGFGDNYYVGITLDSGDVFWTTQNGAAVDDAIVVDNALTGQASQGNAVFAYQTKMIRPLRIPFARRYQFDSAIDTPMIPLSRKDYRDMPNKANTGTITQFFYDPQLGTGYVYLWPAPVDVTGGFKFTWYRPIQNFNTAADDPDLPQEWIDTLIFNLARVMAPEYGVPLEQYNIIKELAMETLEELKGWDREPESVYFGVDFSTMGYIS